MLAKAFSDRSKLFTSSNGMDWYEKAEIPLNIYFITWNGKIYSAFGGGYTFYTKSKTHSKNQFIVDADKKRYAEMIVYSSKDLQNWTMQSATLSQT